jgi:uncharacterized coiled-coil DUF342 family protein
MEEMASEWIKVAKNFDVLESKHQVRCLDETKYRDGLTKAVGDLQDAVSESDRKTQLLVIRIGVETEADGGSSRWEAVESAGETIAKGKRKFEDYRKDQVEMGAKYLSLKTRVTETEESTTNLSGHYRGTMERVTLQLKDLKSGSRTDVRPSEAFSEGVESRFSRGVTGVPWEKHAELAQEVRALK